MEVAGAQVKSCILLAGLFADGTTWVHEPAPSRDHTERMLEAAGVPLLREGGAVGLVGPVAALALPDVEVPGDFSSAAAHLVAGALLGDPEVRLERVNLNPGRTGLLGVMRRMGVEVREEPGPPVAGEPCGTLIVSRTEGLRATVVEPEEVPAMIDELPLVGLLGAMASGTTVVRGAAELRVKESDRIASVVRALCALGVDAREREDGFAVHGGAGVAGGAMESVGDHRLAMLGAVAGLASREGVSVGGFEAVGVSYPGFARDLASAGGLGMITPDLIPDEAEEWISASEAHDLDRIFLVAPSSTPQRLAETVQASRGFVYAASTMGVTGARDAVSNAAPELVNRVPATPDLSLISN